MPMPIPVPVPAPSSASTAAASVNSDVATKGKGGRFAGLVRVLLHLNNVATAILVLSVAVVTFQTGDAPSIICGIYLTLAALVVLLLEVRTPAAVRANARLLLSVSGRGAFYQLCGAAALGLYGSQQEKAPYLAQTTTCYISSEGWPVPLFRETWPRVPASIILGSGGLMALLGYIPHLDDPEYFYRAKTVSLRCNCNSRARGRLATFANITTIVVLLALAIIDFVLGRAIFAGIYTLLSLLLLVVAEVRSSAPSSLAVVNSFVGRGIVYQLAGALNVATTFFLPSQIMSGLVIVLGVVYLILGLRGFEMYPPAEDDEATPLPTLSDSPPVYSPGVDAEPLMDKKYSRGSEEDDERAPFLDDETTRNDDHV